MLCWGRGTCIKPCVPTKVVLFYQCILPFIGAAAKKKEINYKSLPRRLACILDPSCRGMRKPLQHIIRNRQSETQMFASLCSPSYGNISWWVAAVVSPPWLPACPAYATNRSFSFSSSASGGTQVFFDQYQTIGVPRNWWCLWSDWLLYA